MRQATIKRETSETAISLAYGLDGKQDIHIETGVGFLDHMLTLFAAHGSFDLTVSADGDTSVDDHHTVEDVGIVLGQAFKQALGDKAGITRYASDFTPMDEALSLVSIDVSNRPYLVFDVDGLGEKVGAFDTELVEEFFRAFINQAGVTLHIKLMHGSNNHHIIESIFKGFGRVLNEAVTIKHGDGSVPSTKGTLSE
ncbi:imidazoleglycerol-phosphate dehydratase HisB [Alkalibacillus almallahensis]|uniref:imidazoleglycerol-phosphate dehydratase HisB n=1 Tax=Alkalibacillus almallahensis TaxID=1379154 RepID=UPI001423B1FA|nr:imidazoleglycerol-phosphate dehydratase HisB [Alkalibacillus almallahensis]NIK11973.1 imidazoleglycerol-phosphate dehydratase [Alkalibacillus almallahensis]